MTLRPVPATCEQPGVGLRPAVACRDSVLVVAPGVMPRLIKAGNRKLVPLILAAVAGLFATLAPPLAVPVSAASIVSSGPLTQINTSDYLNCDVRHIDDSSPEWYGTTACGTFLATGGTLWGPPTLPAGSNASPRTGYQPVSSTLSGSGTLADPYRSTTVVTLPGSSLTITQVDSYVVGREDYRTSATVTNSAGAAATGILYTAGDCYLQNSDRGYGLQQGSSAVCSTSPNVGGRIEALVPITAGNHWQQDGYSTIWSVIGSQQHFRDTCRCTSYIDNGIGLSWDLNVPAGGSATISWDTVFSPRGTQPLTVEAVADTPTSRVDTLNGYVITVCNNNIDPYELTSLTVTLPATFSYRATGQVGFYTTAPTISGNTLTWAGPVTIEPDACVEMHFEVYVGTQTGTFTIDVEGTATGVPVTPTSAAAQITVTPPSPEELTDLAVTKTATPEPVIAGQTLTYQVTVTNIGPAVSQVYTLIDTLPVGVSLVAVDSDDRCTTITATAVGQRITCSGSSLPAATGSTYTLVVQVDAGLGDGSLLVNTATVEVPDGLLDPDPTNDTAEVVSNVRQSSDMSIALAFHPDEVAPGTPTVLTMTITNSGPSAATEIEFTVTLPDGLTVDSAQLAQAKNVPPDCTQNGQTLTCHIPFLSPGEQPSFDLPVSTLNAAPGRYVATATITAAHDTNPDNNTATAVLLILSLANTGAPIATIAATALALLLLGVFLRYAGRRRMWWR